MNEKINRIESLLRRYKMKRKNEELLEAQEFLTEAENQIAGLELEGNSKLWSYFNYEKAYFLRIFGDYDAADRAFVESAKCASSGDDHLRHLFGTYMSYLTRFYAGRLSPEDCFARLREIDKELFDLRESVKAADVGLLNNAIYNSIKTLADLAFETKSPDFADRAFRVLQHPDHMEHAASGTTSYSFYDLQMKTRLKMSDGDFLGAAKLFSTYIFVPDLPDTAFIAHDPDSPIMNLMEYWQEEIAREYRDFGICVREAGHADGKTAAGSIWQKGLSFPSGHSNKVYQDQIRILLEQL